MRIDSIGLNSEGKEWGPGPGPSLTELKVRTYLVGSHRERIACPGYSRGYCESPMCRVVG